MSKILIIGAGAMGSAFTFPCIDNGHDITLMGSPLENEQIENLKKDSFHKHLECKLSDKIVFSFAANLKEEIKKNYNFIVIGVNSKGINWISNEINTSNSKLPILLLTKGLSIKNNKLEILTNLFKNSNISAVAGPCLAKDLSKRNKTGVVFTNKNISSAKDIGKLVKTNYYFMDYSNDIIGVALDADNNTVRFYVNGSSTKTIGGTVRYQGWTQSFTAVGSTSNNNFTGVAQINLSDGDYVELYIRQNGGGSDNLDIEQQNFAGYRLLWQVN